MCEELELSLLLLAQLSFCVPPPFGQAGRKLPLQHLLQLVPPDVAMRCG
jgi:hypothetical protein